jgi:hypothetical protein
MRYGEAGTAVGTAGANSDDAARKGANLAREHTKVNPKPINVDQISTCRLATVLGPHPEQPLQQEKANFELDKRWWQSALGLRLWNNIVDCGCWCWSWCVRWWFEVNGL